MIKLLGFAAKKQGGKNTSANIIAGTVLHNVGYQTKIDVTTGDLLCMGDSGDFVKLDLNSRNPIFYEWLEENIFPFVKIYSFADELKTFCINTLGLTIEQCYGTNEEKNTKTKYKWSIFRKFLTKEVYDEINKSNCWNKYMTAREILQIFGTDIMRTIYSDCWVDATIKLINKENTRCALIPDVRFPNEVNGIQNNKGKVIHLTRCPFKNEDLHSSELALDNFNGYDAIIDNANMTIEEQSVALAETLKKIGW